MIRFSLPFLFTLAPILALAGDAPATLLTKAPDPQPVPFDKAGSFTEYFFGKNNVLDASYDALQDLKKEYHLPITIGADNWTHVDRNEHVYGSGYGVPGERGTYYYFLDFDPTYSFQKDNFLKTIGAHVEARIRDSEEKLRSFYRDTVWTYEAFAFADTQVGTFKAGQIVQQFGVPWNNSWWEGVTYFDGYKFNPSYGFSWENTAKVSEKLRVDMVAQYFLTDDRVSGAIGGADAESTPPLRERNTGVVRVVPRYKFTDDLQLSIGVSGLARQIKGGEELGTDDHQLAWGTDATLVWKKLSIFAEYIDSHGIITPARYVSGGPSDRQNSINTGINYQWGPIGAHVDYSAGWDHNPSGHQYIFNPGITFQLSKNVTFYTEYVKWTVTDQNHVKSNFDDGFEFIAVWKF